MAGLRPIGHLTGGAGGCFKTVRYEKTTDNEIFPGDPLRLLGTGLVERMNAASASSTPAQRACLGIAARVVASRDGKPKTFDSSGKSIYSPSAASDWIDVYIDSGIIYEGIFHASAGQTEIGSLVGVSASTTAKVSAAGQSGFVLQADVSGTDNDTFRVIDISPRSLDQLTDKGDSAGKISVVINNHAFGQNRPAI